MKRKTGLRRRWMVNNLIYIALIIVVCIVLFSVFTINYYYTNLQTTLTNSASMSAEYFSGELTSDVDSFYLNAKRQLMGETHLYNVERQILFSNGKVVMSSSGLPAGVIPGTPEITESVQSGFGYTAQSL